MNNLYGYCPRYEERTFWSLREVLDPSFSKSEYNLNDSDILSIVETMTGYTTPLISEGAWTNSAYKQVLDLVIRRYMNQYAFSTLSPEFSVDIQKEFIAKLLMVLEMTAPRYLALLGVYDEAKEKLLGPVKNIVKSKNRFNDTPQNTGEYEDDPYTTNINLIDSESSFDSDTIMARIREIEGNYNNVILNWSKEFKSLFLEEENI